MALEEHAELVVKTKSGESYTIAESRIIKDSLTASSSCSSGGGIPAGACNIGTASVAFRAPSGLTYKKLYRATVEIYAWYQGYSKELYGTYKVSSAENNYGVYTLSLSDNISLLDESCYAANDTENAENWLYSQMAGRWNVPSVILNYICNAYNVPHYNAAENEKYVPDSGNTALSTGVSSECSVESVKDFANYLAEYLGCFIVAAPDGRVRFSRLGEREYKTELNKSNISRGTLQRSPYYVHPSVWKVSFDSGYGSSWYVSSDLPDDAAPLSINITNNPFWQVQEDRVPADIYGGKVTQMIKYMWDYLYNAAIKKDGNTVEYMINPFSCTVHVPYHFRIGDIVTVRDYVNGDVFRSYLTDITWTFRGGQQISCAGDDTRTLSVGTSRSAAKKSNDYSKYLYRKSKTGSSGGDTNTYTKAEIDAKDGAIQAAANKAQETADDAVSVNNTQNTQIAALQKSAHAHSNKDVLDKTEQPYTTAERDKLAGLENYVHPAHTAYNKGMYKVAVDDEGHVTEAETMTKSDITALGVPGENTTYEITRKGNLICLEGSDKSSSSAMTNDYVTHGAEKSYDVDPYKSYLIFYQRKPDDATSMAPILDSSEDIWVSKHHDGIGVTGTITAGHFSGADATTSQQGLMSAADKTNLDANTAARHTHVNKSILDQLNEEQWKIINSAANKAHVHDNKDTLDKITDALWNTVYSNTHTHDNKSVLDNTTASYTTADKKKLDGMDLSKYLPLAGGTMTGDIDMQANKRDILVGTQKANTSDGTAVAGGAITTPGYVGDKLKAARSFVGTVTGNDGVWWDVISVRHRNGHNDGVNYGMYLFSKLASTGNLSWNKQVAANTWQGDRTLLDSANYTSYAADKNHTHPYITNSAIWMLGSNGTARWYRLGTLVSAGDFSTTVIRVWSGDGANGYASQNSCFEVHIKDGWQSSQSATNACGVTVYRTRCGTVKVKVIPTAHNTYTVWVYLPWGYWSGNYAIYGKCTSWTSQQLIQSSEPDGTAADIAYYDQAFLTSTVAAATTLTDSGWVAVSAFKADTSAFSQIATSFRKYGDIVFVRGRIQPKSNMTSISLCGTTSTTLTNITPSHSVHGVGVSSDGLTPFHVNITTSPSNSVILTGNFSANKIYDFEFSYMK